jgi:hypothetical protein
MFLWNLTIKLRGQEVPLELIHRAQGPRCYSFTLQYGLGINKKSKIMIFTIYDF